MARINVEVSAGFQATCARYGYSMAQQVRMVLEVWEVSEKFRQLAAEGYRELVEQRFKAEKAGAQPAIGG